MGKIHRKTGSFVTNQTSVLPDIGMEGRNVINLPIQDISGTSIA